MEKSEKPNTQPAQVKKKRVKVAGAKPNVDLQKLFLEAFQKLGTIQSACNEIGIQRKTMYAWLKDVDFQDEFRDSTVALKEVYERTAHHRAVEGVERVVLYQGKPVIDPRDPEKKKILVEREYSDHCLGMLLSAKDPQHYGNRNDTKIQIDIRLIQQVSSEMLNIIRRNVPNACPHCRTLLEITPAIAKEFEQLSTKFDIPAEAS